MPDTLDGLLAAHAAARPSADALVLPGGTVTFGELERRVDAAAAGLAARGVGPGVRTALLVPPIADFFVLAYALLRVRAVPVVVDPGIGVRRVRACLREVAPGAFAGVARAQLARRLLGWCPSARVLVTAGRVGFPGTTPVRSLSRRGGAFVPPARRPGDPAAILFTSGSTGPPKGVEHTEAGLLAQARLVAELYGLGPGEVNLATFPPFALFGPALGMTTVVPRMDPTRPGAVRASRLVRAASEHGATTMFGSPAVLDRLGRDAAPGTRLPALRQVISAGAPVPRDVQRRVLALLGPGARVHTPYGATEALPITSIASDELLDLPEDGICIGRPVPGVSVALLAGSAEVGPGEVGEVVVRGPVVSPGYAERPDATAAAGLDRDGERAHRTGDLAWSDDAGRLWFAGRVAHVVATPEGPLHSVPCEEAVNRHPAVRRTALVSASGRPVLVVEFHPDASAPASELLALADPRIRDVLTRSRLPVDVRHNSKIDREALGRWAAGRLR